MSESDGGQGSHGAEFPTDIEQALTERIKELRTLYSVGQLLAASEERPLADRLAEIARLLPAAFQFPDITVARLVVADRSYESGGFLETPWLQTSRIGGAGPDAIGRIDVALLEPFEGRAQQPFLAEEVELLEALASAVAQAVRRDRAEQELRRSQERFHQIADHIHLVFWIREVGKNRLEYVSPAYEQVWGRPAAELYEDLSPLLTYVLPSDRARMAQQLNEPEPAESSIEYRIVRPDGAVRWILDRGYPVPGEAGAPTRVIGVSEDITVRKQLEQRFGLLSEEITDVITVVAPDGRISYASPSIHEALGYTPAEMEGSSAFDRVHPDDVDSVKRRFASVVAYPGATARAQYRMLDRTGAVRHVESVVRSLIDNPAIGGVVMSSRDITERVHIEQDLRESQRLQAVGRLAGGIAHDFNNLMTVIRSQTELLLLDQPAGPLARDINVIQAAADRAATLTAQLLAFSKDQVLRPEIVDACDIVRGMDRILDRAVGDRVTLVLDLPETVPSIQVDPAQLEQVVMNLVVNARDAMPHGGTVRISARLENGDRDEIPAASDRQGTPNPCVLLRVEDTGVGMSEDVRSRAFEPFYSTKPRGKGTGLGLATAYGFISQSGGTIDIEHLTTHGVILGMTGSGKTGLGVVLLEEALARGIPALILDPKGDMGNLLLNFPALRAEDFRPWIDEAEATRDGKTPDEAAAATAARWQKGLADWGVQPDAMRRLGMNARFTIFTPGSTAGVPLDVVGSLQAPPAGGGCRVAADEIEGFASGLLALINRAAIPCRAPITS
jgi:PAS domain S-box-containing protein